MLINTYVPNTIYMRKDRYNNELPMHIMLNKKKKDCVILDNKLTSGFTFYFNYSNCYIIDPRGFSVKISGDHLNDILKTATIIDGELIGEYCWAFEDSEIVIVRKDIIEKNNIISEDKLLEKRMYTGIKGNIYTIDDETRYIYMGRYFNISFRGYDESSNNAIIKEECSVDKIITHVLSRKDSCLTLLPQSNNSSPQHLFYNKEGNYFRTEKQFICFNDFGKGELSDSDIDNKLASIHIYSRYINISYYVEMTKDFYSRPISKNIEYYTLNDNDLEEIREINNSAFLESESNVSRISRFVNCDMEVKEITRSVYGGNSGITKTDKKATELKLKSLSCKLKNGNTIYFTPFGVK